MPRSATTSKSRHPVRRTQRRTAKRPPAKTWPPANTLVLAIVFIGIIFTFATILFSRTNNHIQATSLRVNSQEAIRVAEAGLEKAVWCLNNPSNGTNCPRDATNNFLGETSATLGKGTYTSTVDNNGSTLTVDVIATVDKATKHIQAQLTTTTANVSFQYGMQTGVGGLVMKNNNKITGNVFSNGSITGTKSLITGDVVLAVGQPAVDQSSDPSVSPLNFTSLGKTSTTLWLAQSFMPSINEKIYSVDLKVAKAGSPPAATLYVYDDNGNQPGTSIYSQAITAPSDASGWESGWTNQLFNTATAPQLSVNTKYWLVIKVSSTGSSTNYWKIVRDTNDSSYASGTSKTSTNGSAWTAVNYDSAFRVYLGGIAPTLEVNCNGVLCPDNNGIGGNAYAQIIKDTNIKQHACYQTITGTVKVGNGSETCSGTGTAPIPCDSTNTVANNGPYCHANNPNFNPAPFPLSSAQIAQNEAQATAGGPPTTGNVTLSDNQSLGPKKIIGDLTIDAGSGTPAKLTGTVWVQGNIYLNGSLKLDEGYGSSSGTIIADNPSDPMNSGRIIVGSSGQLVGNSNSNTYIMGLSMSTSLSESAAAIDVSNNLTAGVVYAANGAVNIQNNADIKEVTAEKIIMQNNTTITYQTGLASVVFTTGPGGSWTYQRGTYQIIND